MIANTLEAVEGVDGLRKAEQTASAMLEANAMKNITAAIYIFSIFYGKPARFVTRTLTKYMSN
jgi:hypothetical protein